MVTSVGTVCEGDGLGGGGVVRNIPLQFPRRSKAVAQLQSPLACNVLPSPVSVLGNPLPCRDPVNGASIFGVRESKRERERGREGGREGQGQIRCIKIVFIA